jgi:ArsR family transcriptional regulator, arsenate/arsenite/antimonite-responsive transcriptional repressor / arsenate reductase (thioredoxin)
VERRTPVRPAGPPEFLPLAGHPVRWQLLRELARSDRQVRELTSLTGCPQSLVSYHLGRLRAARLVSARRSSADGRDAYYTVDLARCGELLAAAGAALHPALGTAGARIRPAAAAGAPARVLFLCTGNSARSQMAEALAQQRSGGLVEAFSAGSHPKPLHPNAVRVMAERGIDLGGRASKHLSVFAAERFGYVITLCDRVREVCPEFPGHPGYIHWSIPDPAAAGDTDRASYPAFQATAAELEGRIGFLLAAIAAPAPPAHQEV